MLKIEEFTTQPKLKLLSKDQIVEIYENALQILEETGVKIKSRQALDILEDKGARVEYEEEIARFSPSFVEDAISAVPKTVQLYNREGNESVILGGDNVHFDPGSAAVRFLESDGETVRKSYAEDLKNIARVNDRLDNIELQSSSISLYDIPADMGDSYRLYIMLMYSSKPIITGALSIDGIENMHQILETVCGEDIAEKPRAVFDICPSPPLKWTEISASNVIDCARFCMPQEIISMPMMGAASPATVAGSVLLHTVETLSAIALAQSVRKGTPVIYGGAPVNFDMRFGTTPLSSIEANMIAASYAQMGKYLGLPTHTYACLSDAKVIDTQAGLETGMSGLLAGLAGINVISGAGMLDFADGISLEKLVIDNEICGLILRLLEGVNYSTESLAADLISDVGPGGDYLTSPHTLKWFKKDTHYPNKIIDRQDRDAWEKAGKTTLFERAQEKVKTILAAESEVLSGERKEALDGVVAELMDKYSIDSLPLGPR